MMHSGISVIIPTYNGAHRVSRVLHALTLQTRPAGEVVVVIDGSTDPTRQVVESFQSSLPLKIVDISNRGRAGARNAGVAASTGELIVFLDDDMRPFPDCLLEHAGFHQRISGALLVGYILEDPALFTTDIQRYRLGLYERAGWTRKNRELVPLKENEIFLAAANLSVQRTTFQRLNGFDESLHDAEDFDMGNRAFSMDIPIYYKEELAKAYHDDPITCRSYITRQREYIRSLRKLYAMKPEVYKRYLHRIQPQPSVLKRMIYFVISTDFLVRLIDKGVMAYLLPESIRYPLYDYIINGLVQVYPDRKLS